MHATHHISSWLIGLWLLMQTMLAATVQAEASLDLYYGSAQTENSDIHVRLLYIVPEYREDYSIDDSAKVFGIRMVYWLDSIPGLGLGAGLSNFHANTAEIETAILPLSWFAAYRWKLNDVHLYTGFGGAIAYFTIDTRYLEALREPYRETSFESGWELFGGIKWQQTSRIGWFLEYKHSDFDIDFQGHSIYLPPLSYGSVVETVNGSYKTNQFYLGISLLF